MYIQKVDIRNDFPYYHGRYGAMSYTLPSAYDRHILNMEDNITSVQTTTMPYRGTISLELIVTTSEELREVMDLLGKNVSINELNNPEEIPSSASKTDVEQAKAESCKIRQVINSIIELEV